MSLCSTIDDDRDENSRWTLWFYKFRGKASKNNTLCSCGLCRDEKYRDKRKKWRWED